ncbi:hypothetical protein SSX86_002142 [Deinandra increscens subsp. villosa]|uniref:Uncharacterized protein n=1 Tax=Deinandra increscens subsp. villosa TaxID=3103831 RepID=A0AAP0DN08_9ASTR
MQMWRMIVVRWCKQELGQLLEIEEILLFLCLKDAKEELEDDDDDIDDVRIVRIDFNLLGLLYFMYVNGSYCERLLDCISNGKLAEDRRYAIAELQSVAAESHGAQLAFGEMGEYREREDVEMV